ncbi:hypothetical protein DZC52_09900 [Wenzhouxiangella sediminis]|uniref:Tetratricopeptide repeat protein n=1 Tax=Wenzhouxiangella sediminis TaxID=1792836 RepID=A0A3E1K7Y1_9GAMM|nr:hypothetical protein DZC52_09900 [Wenzhouxiangella sediminis]
MLLPVLILTTELFLLTRPGEVKRVHWRLWVTVFLVLPLVAIIAYLGARWGYSEAVVYRRGFTAGERMMTQAVVLWEYLFNALLPSTHRVGPFHDNYPVYRSLVSFNVLVSTLGWAVLMSLGVLFRKKVPMLGFAVFWFLGAHMVESTVVPLELYFEHRNYVPLVGVFLAVSHGVYSLAIKVTPIVTFGVVAYILLSLFLLLRLSTIWGNPSYASDYWLEHNPDSLRATMHQSEVLLANGEVGAALMHMDLSRLTNPDHSAYIGIFSEYVRCAAGAGRTNDEGLSRIASQLPSASFYPSLPSQILLMTRERVERFCSSYSLDSLYELSKSALANPAYHSHVESRHTLLSAMALASRGGRPFDAMRSYEDALRVRHNPRLLGQLVSLYIELQEFERGCRFLKEMRAFKPTNVYLRSVWSDGISGYEAAISESFSGEC